MTDPQIPHLDRLNAYIDDELAPNERAEFEAMLDRDPELRGHLARLRMAEQELRGAFHATTPATPPLPDAAAAGQTRAPAAPIRTFLSFELQRRHLAGLAAAAIFIAATVGLVLYLTTPVGKPASWLYARHSYSMEPDHICRTPEEFIDYTYEQLGQAVTADFDAPPELVGWVAPDGYRRSDADAKRILLARAPTGEPIIVLFQANHWWKLHRDDESVHVFRRKLGDVHITELSPFDRPMILDLISPALPPDAEDEDAIPRGDAGSDRSD